MSAAPTAPLPPSQSHLHTPPPNDDREQWINQQSEEGFHKERPEGWSPDHLGTAPTQYSHGSGAQTLSTQKTSHRVHGLRSKLGLQPLAPVDEEHDLAEHQDLLWSRIRLALREPFAEFMGVFILVLFGDGSVAQVMLSAGQVTAPGIFGVSYR
jgi:aquaglyceroporin related protein